MVNKEVMDGSPDLGMDLGMDLEASIGFYPVDLFIYGQGHLG